MKQVYQEMSHRQDRTGCSNGIDRACPAATAILNVRQLFDVSLSGSSVPACHLVYKEPESIYRDPAGLTEYPASSAAAES